VNNRGEPACSPFRNQESGIRMRSLAEIAERVCIATGYDIDAIRAKKRDLFRVVARQIFCYYARLEGYSLNEIAFYISIDHVTVHYSSRMIEEKKGFDKIIRHYINKYEAYEQSEASC